MMNCQSNTKLHQIFSITIDDVTVRLIFTAEVNHEVPAIVRDMLKKPYLQQHTA